jgi:hypothetical protein
MSKKIYRKVNKYEEAGWLKKNAGGIASALGTAGSFASDLVSDLKGNQEAYNAAKSGINQISGTTFNAGNTSDLMSQWNSVNYANPVDPKSLRSDSGALELVTGVTEGLSAGASFGPYGAIAGAALGLGKGFASWFGGKANAKKRAEELNNQGELANDRLQANFSEAAANLQEQQIANAMMNYAADGGKIEIKPSKKGTFTAEATKRGYSVQEFANKVLANKDNYSTSMIKTRNANKWKHAEGGPLETNGITWPSELMFINNGGTHEQNPNEGIQIGVDNEGVPNLVEEGEVIYNDYVFSNRLKVPKKDKKEFNLGKKDITFADAVEELAKESKERPNDAISERGLRANLDKLINSQEGVRNIKKSKDRNRFDYGGFTFEQILEKFESDPEFTKLSREEQDAFVKKTLESFASRKSELETFQASPQANGAALFNPYEYKDIANISKSYADSLKLPTINTSNIVDKYQPEIVNEKIKEKSPSDGKFNWASTLRYAPVLGNAIGLLTNKADYSNADLISNQINSLPTIGFNPLGDYLTYNPMDVNYLANKTQAQAAATRRNIMNNYAGNRGAATAALMAADYNAQTALGDAYMKGLEYNQGLKERVAAFNRGTNQANAEMGLKASMANAERAKTALDARIKEATMREGIASNTAAARSANLTTLFDSLGAIGKEEFMKDLINNRKDLSYTTEGQYKTKSCGGKINRRRRK